MEFDVARRLPPLNSLRGFEAAARLGHFGRAASELNLTHGAISHQIRVLEEALQTKLFERSGGRLLRLTGAGRLLLPTVQDALDSIAEAATRVRLPQLRGRLRLATAQGFAVKWLIRRLGKFLALYPQIELSVIVLQSGDQIIDDVDVSVLWGDGGWEHVWVRPLVQLPSFPVCSPQLLNTKPIGSPKDLRQHVLIHADEGAEFSRWMLANDVDDVPYGKGIRFSHAHLAIDAASFGYGIALGDKVLAGEQLEQGTLVKLFNNDLAAAHNYYVVCDRTRHGAPMVGVFLEWLAAELQTLDI
jgi:LysR family glycine cleavage system transcriptional activator